MSDRKPYLTMAEAGKLLGLKGRPRFVAERARRLIEAKERRIKKPIMLRCGGEGRGKRYMVSEWMLKKRMPEAFSRRDELVERFRAELDDIKEQLAANTKILEHLGAEFAATRRPSRPPPRRS